MVGELSKSATIKSTLRHFRIIATSWPALRESPPRSKNVRLTLTVDSSPSEALQMASISRSKSSLGSITFMSWYSCTASFWSANSASGPFGMRSMTCMSWGTRYSGSSCWHVFSSVATMSWTSGGASTKATNVSSLWSKLTFTTVAFEIRLSFFVKNCSTFQGWISTREMGIFVLNGVFTGGHWPSKSLVNCDVSSSTSCRSIRSANLIRSTLFALFFGSASI